MKNKLYSAYYKLITSPQFLSFLKVLICLLLPFAYNSALQLLHMEFLISPNNFTLGPEGEVCQFGSGSGSGSATRPVGVDVNLTLPHGSGEELSEGRTGSGSRPVGVDVKLPPAGSTEDLSEEVGDSNLDQTSSSESSDQSALDQRASELILENLKKKREPLQMGSRWQRSTEPSNRTSTSKQRVNILNILDNWRGKKRVPSPNSLIRIPQPSQFSMKSKIFRVKVRIKISECLLV